MERIIGKNGNEGATPEQVVNYLIGNAKVGSTNLSMKLAQRMQNVLGAGSEEWNALRQATWQKLTSKPEGMIQPGPQMQNSRIMDFLNGSGASLAKSMFSPPERQTMLDYASLMQQLTPKPGAVNYSNTAPILGMMARNMGDHLMASIGAHVAGPAGAAAGVLTSRAIRGALKERGTAGRVARSLYQGPGRADATFRNQMTRYGSVAARAAVTVNPRPGFYDQAQ
jgi:hypothetical protein